MTNHEFCEDCAVDPPDPALAELLHQFETLASLETDIQAMLANPDETAESGAAEAYGLYQDALSRRPTDPRLGDMASQVEDAAWALLENRRALLPPPPATRTKRGRVVRPSSTELLDWLKSIGNTDGRASATPLRLLTVTPARPGTDDAGRIDSELDRLLIAESVPLPDEPTTAVLIISTERYITLEERYRDGYVRIWDQGPAFYRLTRDELRRSADNMVLTYQGTLGYRRRMAS
jgi:hypothetical protein